MRARTHTQHTARAHTHIHTHTHTHTYAYICTHTHMHTHTHSTQENLNISTSSTQNSHTKHTRHILFHTQLPIPPFTPHPSLSPIVTPLLSYPTHTPRAALMQQKRDIQERRRQVKYSQYIQYVTLSGNGTCVTIITVGVRLSLPPSLHNSLPISLPPYLPSSLCIFLPLSLLSLYPACLYCIIIIIPTITIIRS